MRRWIGVVGLLVVCLAPAFAQDKPASLTEWNGRPVEHIGKENGVSAPVVMHSVAPVLPEPVRGRHPNGPVLSMVVDTDGLPQNVHILKSSGDGEFDAVVVAAVKQYRFKPAMKDGKPVQVELSMEVNINTF